MKKLLILLPIILLACESHNVSRHPTDLMCNGVTFDIVVIDSCEYLAYGNAAGNEIFSHKGNCKYCIIRGQFVLEAVVKDIKRKD